MLDNDNIYVFLNGVFNCDKKMNRIIDLSNFEERDLFTRTIMVFVKRNRELVL